MSSSYNSSEILFPLQTNENREYPDITTAPSFCNFLINSIADGTIKSKIRIDAEDIKRYIFDDTGTACSGTSTCRINSTSSQTNSLFGINYISGFEDKDDKSLIYLKVPNGVNIKNLTELQQTQIEIANRLKQNHDELSDYLKDFKVNDSEEKKGYRILIGYKLGCLLNLFANLNSTARSTLNTRLDSWINNVYGYAVQTDEDVEYKNQKDMVIAMNKQIHDIQKQTRYKENKRSLKETIYTIMEIEFFIVLAGIFLIVFLLVYLQTVSSEDALVYLSAMMGGCFILFVLTFTLSTIYMEESFHNGYLIEHFSAETDFVERYILYQKAWSNAFSDLGNNEIKKISRTSASRERSKYSDYLILAQEIDGNVYENLNELILGAEVYRNRIYLILCILMIAIISNIYYTNFYAYLDENIFLFIVISATILVFAFYYYYTNRRTRIESRKNYWGKSKIV